MMKKRYRIFLAFFVGLISVMQASEGVQLVGSDLLKNVLKASIIDYQSEDKVSLDVRLDGSMQGLEDLESGKLVIGLIALPADEEKTNDELLWLPWIYQVAYVVVNSQNRCEELSLNQLEDIYANTSEREYRHWEDLGVTGYVAARQITPYIVVSEENVVSELFKYSALGGESLRDNLGVVSNAQELEAQIIENPDVIGISDRKPKSKELRLLPIAIHTSKQYAYDANSENIYYGDYPMALPFYIVCKKENVKQLKPLIAYLMSDSVMQTLEDEGFIAVPKSVKQRGSF